MRAYVLTLDFLVPFLEKELKELGIKVLSKNSKGIFVEGTFDDFYSITFYSHLAQDLLLYINEFKEDSFNIDDSLYPYLSRGKTMRITASTEIIYNYSPFILSTLSKKFNYKVDLKNPFYEFKVVEDNKKLYVGVRLFNNLVKRDYRIHSHKQSINSSIAFALSFGYEGNILDPYTKDGSIVIEKSLHQNRTLRKYQKSEIIEFSKRFIDEIKIKPLETKQYGIFASSPNPQDLKKSKMNAKIAGSKDIRFSLSTTDQLDYKFIEKDISVIATIPPLLSKNNQSQKQKNEILLFLERSKQLLLKKGILSLYINSKTIDFIKENNIKFIERFANNEFFNIIIKKEDL